MPTKQVSPRRNKQVSPKRTKSTAQRRHLAKASEAMRLYKSGKASSLKKAWASVR